MGFENVERKVTVTGYDKDNFAYICKTDKGIFKAKKSPKLKGVKLQYNIEVDMKLGRKDGGDWFINEANFPEKKEVKKYDKGSNRYDSEGQERGNLRNNLTTFIISRWESEDIKADIQLYLDLLAYGEDLKLGKVPKEGSLSPTPAADESEEEIVEQSDDVGF